ncbi:immunoglobulin A1 protease autotransporter-like [Pecten maximus]|uniref:immunoglobulin A1 protease autotransporter-like n=1 Tax=Pecten maximus TaxID=6579 RepID=UPI001458D6D7|nr:immunoglobulin A1 protease autotransporter-like [Pecten maximus]
MFGRISLFLLIQLAKQGLIHARPSHDPGQTAGQCPSAGPPSGGLRELNVIYDGKPRYRLDFHQSRSGYVPGRTYIIYVRAQDPSQTFGDILLSVTSESRTCHHGNFSIQSQRYYQPKGCDHMVLKNTREFEHSFAFQWTAPTCGCVILRARVRSVNNIYYLDNENVIDGYLTKRVCRRHMSTILSKISHNELEDLLCQVVSKSDEQMINEDHFLRRRKMNPSQMTDLEKDALQISLRQRVYEVKQCCAQTGAAKTDCLGDIRRHRIDQLCANTQHLPFTVRSDAYMTERRDNCCWRLGERRYDCFMMGHQGGSVPSSQSDVDTDVAMVTGVNVLDESDPVNDLEDYPNRLSEELVQLNMSHEELEGEDNAAAVPNKGLVSTLPPHFHKKTEKSLVLQRSKTDLHQNYQPVATGETSQLQQPPVEDSTKMGPTPQTRSLTQTTQGLEKKLLRAQVELECCQQGKQYGAVLVTRDTWDRCEQRTRKVTKAMKGKKKRWCRRYHFRCCVESGQRSPQESNKDDGGARDQVNEDTRDPGRQKNNGDNENFIDSDNEDDDDIDDIDTSRNNDDDDDNHDDDTSASQGSNFKKSKLIRDRQTSLSEDQFQGSKHQQGSTSNDQRLVEAVESSINPQQPQTVESSGVEQSKTVESSGVEQPETVESSDIEQTQNVESSGVEQPETVESSGVEQSETVESSGVEQSETVESSGVEQSETVESSGVEQPETVESSSVEEPATVESSGVEQPETVESSSVEQSETVESSGVEQPETVESSSVEQPATVESSGVEQPETVESSSVEQSETVESSGVEQPETVESSSVEQPATVESSGVEQPETVESSSVEQSETVESSGVEQPETVESSSVEQSETVESSGVEQPETVESSDVEQPETVESSGVEQPENVDSSSVEQSETVESSRVEQLSTRRAKLRRKKQRRSRRKGRKNRRRKGRKHVST